MGRQNMPKQRLKRNKSHWLSFKKRHESRDPIFVTKFDLKREISATNTVRFQSKLRPIIFCFYLLLKKLVCVLVMVGLYTYMEFFSPNPTPQNVGTLISLLAVRSLKNDTVKWHPSVKGDGLPDLMKKKTVVALSICMLICSFPEEEEE